MTGHLTLNLNIKETENPTDVSNRLEEALRSGWTRLRLDHPTLASWVEYDRSLGKCKKLYDSITSENDKITWLEQTFHRVSNGQTGLEWCNSDPPVPKLPTLYLITPPSDFEVGKVVRRDIVFRSHHDVIDGIGTLHMFNNLMRHAAQAFIEVPSEGPDFKTAERNLSPPFRIAAAIPAKLTNGQEARLKQIQAHNRTLREHVEILSVPFKRGSLLPGRHQRVDITLSVEETLQILAACKKLEVTITHAYHAAVAMVARDSQERSEKERTLRYLSYCLVNERPHCNPPYNSPAHAASVYHSVSGKALAIDLTVPNLNSTEQSPFLQKAEFRNILKQVEGYYRAVREDTEYLPMIPSYWKLGTPQYPPTPDSPIPPPVPAPSLTPSVSISSMGLVDRIISPSHGPFDLDNPWVTGEELGTGLGVFLATFKGRLSVSAAYNEAYHDRDNVLGFLRECNSQVAKGLKD